MALDATVGGPNSNAYGDLVAFKAWADDRGQAYGDDQTLSAAIIRGTDAIERAGAGRWVGTKASASQRLAWPRSDVVDDDGNDVPDNAIPWQIQYASFHAAVVESESPGALSPPLQSTSVIKREKVGQLEVEYQGGEATKTAYTSINELLEGWMNSVTGSSLTYLLRA